MVVVRIGGENSYRDPGVSPDVSSAGNPLARPTAPARNVPRRRLLALMAGPDDVGGDGDGIGCGGRPTSLALR